MLWIVRRRLFEPLVEADQFKDRDVVARASAAALTADFVLLDYDMPAMCGAVP